MSAHTGETEVETIETPTPPKLPSPQNRREDDIIEEDSNQDSEEEDDDSQEDETEDESETHGNYHYTYETDSDDPFSGDIECCLRNVINRLSITETKSDDRFITYFKLSFIWMYKIIRFRQIFNKFSDR